MKINSYALLSVLLLISFVSFGAALTQINYNLDNLGAGRWQYNYLISNIGLSVPIEEVTVYFDYETCSNLQIETAEPLATLWDEIIWQPNSIIKSAGGYDVLALNSGIQTGTSISGFSVSFEWLGAGNPSGQVYEIINPSDFSVSERGFTIPEPGTIIFFSTAIYYLAIKRSNRRIF